VVESSVESFTRQAEDRGIVIENTVAPGISVYGDDSLIQMAVNNLLGNAIKYGAEKGIIRIGVLHLDTKVAIEVYNDGRPLTVDQLEKLFKRFSRLDSPEGKRVRGTGLGLFLCKEIVELHGGTIRCEPREKGNAFIFTIPVNKT
jgi:signal transduction histidine kinase